MIVPPANTQIWIAAGVTDLRRGFTGLSALVQTKLEKSAMSGQVFILHQQQSHRSSLLSSQQSSLIQAAPMKNLVRINSMRSRYSCYRCSRSQRLFHYSPTLGDTPSSSLRLRHNRST